MQEYSPDLTTVRSWMPERLISLSLDPGLSITIGYDFWNVELKNGDVEYGMISSETPAIATLNDPGITETVFSRNLIKTLTALNTSAIPSGMEQQFTKQEMTDVIGYLKSR